jgi:hypothetical protein
MTATHTLAHTPAPAADAVSPGHLAEALLGPMRVLVRAWQGHQALLAWNLRQPRPAACACLPERLWRRHSALLSLEEELRS